jgi:hypothetical protein
MPFDYQLRNGRISEKRYHPRYVCDSKLSDTNMRGAISSGNWPRSSDFKRQIPFEWDQSLVEWNRLKSYDWSRMHWTPFSPSCVGGIVGPIRTTTHPVYDRTQYTVQWCAILHTVIDFRVPRRQTISWLDGRVFQYGLCSMKPKKVI